MLGFITLSDPMSYDKTGNFCKYSNLGQTIVWPQYLKRFLNTGMFKRCFS